jgi:hypothetical protein
MSRLLGDINPATGTMIASILYQKNMTVDDFSRQYDLVSGKISMKAHAMLARFNALGGEHKIETYTNEEVAILFSYKRTKDMRFTLTMKEVMDAGICMGNKGMKDTWKKHPRSMLFARVVSEACRVLCPAASAGIYTPEEVSDFTMDEVPIHDDWSSASSTPMQSPKPQLDPAVCPFECEWKGRRWEELPDNLLQAALEYNQTPPTSIPIIQSIIQSRQETETSYEEE